MAYDMIELPEPYRTDWRFAFIGAIIATGLGNKEVTPKKVYDEMTAYFDTLKDHSSNKTQEELESQVKKAIAAAKKRKANRQK